MFSLFIATKEEVIFEGKAKDLKAPGTLGYFEILTDHASMISTLKEGELSFTDDGKKIWNYKIFRGFLEVSENQVSVLIDI